MLLIEPILMLVKIWALNNLQIIGQLMSRKFMMTIPLLLKHYNKIHYINYRSLLKIQIVEIYVNGYINIKDMIQMYKVEYKSNMFSNSVINNFSHTILV